MSSHGKIRKLIKHESERYTVPQAKKHLSHHKSVKQLRQQIKSRSKK